MNSIKAMALIAFAAGILVASVKVPAGEQKELFAIVGTTMPDIVTRQ